MGFSQIAVVMLSVAEIVTRRTLRVQGASRLQNAPGDAAR
jgi:hypothetical protein